MSASAAANGGGGENPEQYCLKWNDFQTNITSTFADLRDEEALLDVSLVVAVNCNAAARNSGERADRHKVIKAHKLVLCACSPLFRSMLSRATHPEPMIFLHGVGAEEMEAILTFMYEGQVNVNQEDLAGFLAAAEELRIRGLSDKSNGGGGSDAGQSGGEKRKRARDGSLAGKSKRNRTMAAAAAAAAEMDESYGYGDGSYDPSGQQAVDESYAEYEQQTQSQTPHRVYRNKNRTETPVIEEDYHDGKNRRFRSSFARLALPLLNANHRVCMIFY